MRDLKKKGKVESGGGHLACAQRPPLPAEGLRVFTRHMYGTRADPQEMAPELFAPAYLKSTAMLMGAGELGSIGLMVGATLGRVD